MQSGIWTWVPLRQHQALGTLRERKVRGQAWAQQRTYETSIVDAMSHVRITQGLIPSPVLTGDCIELRCSAQARWILCGRGAECIHGLIHAVCFACTKILLSGLLLALMIYLVNWSDWSGAYVAACSGGASTMVRSRR